MSILPQTLVAADGRICRFDACRAIWRGPNGRVGCRARSSLQGDGDFIIDPPSLQNTTHYLPASNAIGDVTGRAARTRSRSPPSAA